MCGCAIHCNFYKLCFPFNSKRRKKRGLPAAGDKSSKDGRKAPGKPGVNASGKEKTRATADMRKSHEAESVKSITTGGDVTASEQGESNLDDRFTTVYFYYLTIYPAQKQL